MSDSAGVTENLSVMLDNYAKSIGKTASQLTEAEKNQAYLNRTMYAAEPFAGAMADYMDTLAGKQGQYSQAMRETQVAYAEALEPVLKNLTEMGTGVLNFLNETIEKNPELVAGVTAFATILTGATIAIIALASAKTAYAKATGVATMSTKAFTTALLTNPLTWWIVGISAAVGVITNAVSKFNNLKNSLNELKDELNQTSEAQERYNQLVSDTLELTDENIKKLREDKKAIEQQLQLKEKQIEKERELQAVFKKDNENTNEEISTREKAIKNGKDYNKIKEASLKMLTQYNKVIYENMETEREQQRTQLIDIAQNKMDIEGKQDLLNILKQGKTETEEYADAKSQLVKVYPELAKVNENTIRSTQEVIDAENKAAEEEWRLTQEKIKNSIEELQTIKSNKEQYTQLAKEMGKSTWEVTQELENQINILNNLASLTSSDFKGSIASATFKPKKTSSSKSSSSYQNKALENYKKQIEHKKALDQINLRDEINMYQTALNKYAKTTDEKMELERKLYELRKGLTDKTLDDCTAQIDYEVNMGYISTQQELARYEQAYNMYAKTFEQKRELEVKIRNLRVLVQEEIIQKMKEEADKEREILNQKTEDYKSYMQEQKNIRGAEYDVKEQEADLSKIIEMHRNYLNQIMRDERYSLEERESIYREELNIIKDYEQQKRDARVNAVNNTLSQLKSAITKQIEEMEQADEEAIKKNIELVEEWKNTRIEAINAEYDARIEAIQKELDALDKAEQQKSRDEEDAEYEKKRKRLEELAQYEHDATTKANYLKELAKLEEEYQKTVDKRLLEDKKEALKEQQDLLKEEQSSKVDKIEEEAEKQKEQYEKQLDSLKEYYDKQKEMAEETAQKMLLNVEQNQNQILNLLTKYGDKYEITGQSLGEKLAQGINNGLADKIQSIIQTVQDRIDSAIENQISKWTSAAYKYEQATSKAQTKTVQTNVTQNNYIQQNPEMPSETYRKLNNVSRNLASELAGV